MSEKYHCCITAAEYERFVRQLRDVGNGKEKIFRVGCLAEKITIGNRQFFIVGDCGDHNSETVEKAINVRCANSIVSFIVSDTNKRRLHL